MKTYLVSVDRGAPYPVSALTSADAFRAATVQHPQAGSIRIEIAPVGMHHYNPLTEAANGRA